MQNAYQQPYVIYEQCTLGVARQGSGSEIYNYIDWQAIIGTV